MLPINQDAPRSHVCYNTRRVNVLNPNTQPIHDCPSVTVHEMEKHPQQQRLVAGGRRPSQTCMKRACVARPIASHHAHPTQLRPPVDSKQGSVRRVPGMSQRVAFRM